MIISQAVPTNIITGFLGVGKTTAILHLLAQKPANERWAVLVNEFGEVGIDGGLLAGNQPRDSDIFIREVPGGCMCCASGLPMQIALNRLLTTAKPDRLLIEPTGLGHPKEVISVLTQDYYAPIINLKATLTLIDPRKLTDSRYTEHDTFNQQLAVADIIIANKSDQCDVSDFEFLDNYLLDKGYDKKPVHKVSFGKIPLALLTSNSHRPLYHLGKQNSSLLLKTNTSSGADPDGVANSATSSFAPTVLQEGEHVKVQNQGEGFISTGWRFHESFIFDRQKLFALLSGLSALRIKAFFITPQGVFGYNLSDNSLAEFELDDALESRLECIDTRESVLDGLEQQLLACVYAPSAPQSAR